MDPKTKPAGASGGYRKLSVTNWRAHRKNTVQGFLSLTVPSGIVIHNSTFHQKDSARGIGLPTRQCLQDDGCTSYTPLIESSTKDARQRLQALEDVDRFREPRDE
jgi:hypothetical protein